MIGIISCVRVGALFIFLDYDVYGFGDWFMFFGHLHFL